MEKSFAQAYYYDYNYWLYLWSIHLVTATMCFKSEKYLKSVKSSYDKDDGLIPGSKPQEDTKLQPGANGTLFEPGSL